METALLSYYLQNEDFRDTCDFNLTIDKDTNGVYEVIRVINGIPLYLEEHIGRFFNSCDLKKISTGIQENQIKKRIKSLIELNKLSIGNIKWALLINENNKNDFLIWVSPFFYPDDKLINNGVKCLLYNDTRKNPNAKDFKKQLQSNIADFISKKEIFEVILTDNKDKIYEGSRTNLFFIKNEIIFTSKDNDVLEGISREKVMKICKEMNIQLIKKDIYVNELKTFDAAFLSGTSINLLPIKELEKFSYDTHNKLFLKLLNEYKLKLETYIENFKWNL